MVCVDANPDKKTMIKHKFLSEEKDSVATWELTKLEPEELHEDFVKAVMKLAAPDGESFCASSLL
jgi:hypothetical protein